MTLQEHYSQIGNNPSPKRAFRTMIAEACGVTELTVYRWLSGEIIPEKLKKEKIAELTGIPVEQLFPTQETN
jgi:Helix-turn-helix.